MCRVLIFFNSPRHPGLKCVGNYQVIFYKPTHTYTDTPTKKGTKKMLQAGSDKLKKKHVKKRKKKRTHSALLVLHSTSEVHSEYPRQWVDLSNNPDGEK